MANPHRAAVRRAAQDVRWLKTHFDKRIGSVIHPRGDVLSAYRRARRDMAGVLRAGDRREARGILAGLRRELLGIGVVALGEAIERGQESAQQQLAAYEASGESTEQAGQTPDLQPLLTGWLAAYDAQARQIGAWLAAGGDDDLVVGDENRLGLLQAAPIAVEAARWLAQAMAQGISTQIVGREQRTTKWDKQAFAAIDRRTTETCLRVHGQIRPLNGEFKLTGTPRFADEMDWSPFHHWCRTSVALYLPEFEDGLTQELRDTADTELRQRERARDAAATKEAVKQVEQVFTPRTFLHEWVRGARRRASVLLKNGVKEELGIDGLVYTRRNYNFTRSEIALSKASAREMYESTQADLRSKGIRQVTLYRGLKSRVTVDGVIESWTSDPATARKFDGYDVIQLRIPVSRILAYHRGPNWRNGPYGEQYEYIVMRETPK